MERGIDELGHIGGAQSRAAIFYGEGGDSQVLNWTVPISMTRPSSFNSSTILVISAMR